MKPDLPTEASEQRALFQWAALYANILPALRLLYHIPNGGSRNPIEAKNLKTQGVKAGIPDICLPVARGRYHGMYIEMKRTKGGRLSPDQAGWLMSLQEQGHYAVVCAGWQAAADEIQKYLGAEV